MLVHIPKPSLGVTQGNVSGALCHVKRRSSRRPAPANPWCHRRKSSLTLPTWLTRFIPAHSICVASSHVHTMTSTRLGLYKVQHGFRTLDPILCKAL